MKNLFEGRVGVAIGTGRCGTKFLYRVLDMEPGVSSVHERNRLNEAFHRYCKWYRLPVDDEGFLHIKELEIQQDLKDHFFSFEASAQLSLSVRELYSRLGAKFVLLVRSPERVVNSYLRKGIYDKPVVRANPELGLGYQDWGHFHHFLGRIVPMGVEFLQWNEMTRVGKLAWYWNTINTLVLEQFKDLPKTHWRVEKLEELSYDTYLEITRFLEFQSAHSQETYDEIRRSRPNALTNVPTIASWNTSEIAEFEREVEPMAKRLGYEYRVDHLPLPEPEQPSANQISLPSLSARQQMAKKVLRLEGQIKKLAGKIFEK